MEARKLQEEISKKVGVRPNLEQLAELLQMKKGSLKSTSVLPDTYDIDEIAARAKILLIPQPIPAGPPPADSGAASSEADKETKKRKQIVTIARSFGIDLDLAKRLAGLPADAPDTTIVVKKEFEKAFNEYQISQESQAARQDGTVHPVVRAKLLEIIKRDHAISRSNYGKGGAGIKLEPSGDIRFRYPDPMDDLLEDVDRFYVDDKQRRRKRQGPNYIRITRKMKERFDSGRYTWRSPEFWGLVERLLGQYFVAAPLCKECGRPIMANFRSTARELLTGKVKLDELKPPVRHDPCLGIAHVLRDLELELQGKDADDPETIALRSAAYVDAVKKAKAWLFEKYEIEVTDEELIESLRLILKGESSDGDDAEEEVSKS